MQFKAGIVLAGALVAGVALAENQAHEPQVKARMALMSGIKKDIGVLGGMAKGAIPFDAVQAGTAKVALGNAAVAIPDAFRENAMDPASEALPAIWKNWDDFAAKAVAMEQAVASVDVSSLSGVQTGMKSVGQTCGACHKMYRMDK
jgi:cytochrome c556